MKPNKAILIFVLSFVFDAAVATVRSVAGVTYHYSSFVAFLGGFAEALGHIVIPFLIIVVWALISFVRKRQLPSNFAVTSLQFMAVCALLGALIIIVQAFI